MFKEKCVLEFSSEDVGRRIEFKNPFDGKQYTLDVLDSVCEALPERPEGADFRLKRGCFVEQIWYRIEPFLCGWSCCMKPKMRFNIADCIVPDNDNDCMAVYLSVNSKKDYGADVSHVSLIKPKENSKVKWRLYISNELEK